MSRRNRRSFSKECCSSVLADSGVSLSSPSEVICDKDSPIKDDGDDWESVITDDDKSDSYIEEVTATVKKPKRKPRTKPRKQYICHICCKKFGGNTDLRRHFLTHTNERPFKCEQCSKCYRQRINLSNHVKSAHECKKEFICSVCGKTFALKERLKLHLRVHSGEKPYKCPKCPKEFARGGQLQQHVVTHSGIKNVVCDKCNLTFSTRANLRMHRKRHEEGPNHVCHKCQEMFLTERALRVHLNVIHFKLREFECELCKKIICNTDMKAHMKSHSNLRTHICEVCNSYFTQKSQYNVHMRMHTGERPYQCRVCWQSFGHSSVLKLHIRKHTGEKPFKCLICKDKAIAFSQLAHLKTHMKKIHKKDNPYMCAGCNEFFKIKIYLQSHMETCKQCENSESNIGPDENPTLSQLRFLLAVVLKKISTEEKLKKLGFEKRLIDNVIISSLKLAQRQAHEDQDLSEIERLKLNTKEFLEWIVPKDVMQKFKEQSLSVDDILENIVSSYFKQV